MKFQMHYGSHLPILMKIVSMTDGDVLECGTGLYSTPVLHWMCVPNKRKLVSYELDPKYFEMVKQYEDEYHEMHLVENWDWDTANIERPWDVVLIDHSPETRRKEEARRLANYAKFILLHDSDWKADRHYRYKEIYPLFKYRFDYVPYHPHTTIVSNFIDLGTLDL